MITICMGLLPSEELFGPMVNDLTLQQGALLSTPWGDTPYPEISQKVRHRHDKTYTQTEQYKVGGGWLFYPKQAS